jgi:hypothetical protein
MYWSKFAEWSIFAGQKTSCQYRRGGGGGRVVWASTAWSLRDGQLGEIKFRGGQQVRDRASSEQTSLNSMWPTGTQCPPEQPLTFSAHPFRFIANLHLLGLLPHVRDRDRRWTQVLGLQPLRPAGHWEHDQSVQPGGCEPRVRCVDACARIMMLPALKSTRQVYSRFAGERGCGRVVWYVELDCVCAGFGGTEGFFIGRIWGGGRPAISRENDEESG